MNRTEHTRMLHQQGGFNCAQSLLVAFGEACGLTEDRARALGRPLGGGVAQSAGMCGYLTASMMVLSLACNNPEEKKARVATHDAVAKLLQQFKAKHGHLNCRELLGADMSTPEGRQKIDHEKLIAKNCYGFGWDAAAILDELLDELLNQAAERIIS
jgi:C_GCAxxG_C_C family probable redox protein